MKRSEMNSLALIEVKETLLVQFYHFCEVMYSYYLFEYVQNTFAVL